MDWFDATDVARIMQPTLLCVVRKLRGRIHAETAAEVPPVTTRARHRSFEVTLGVGNMWLLIPLMVILIWRLAVKQRALRGKESATI